VSFEKRLESIGEGAPAWAKVIWVGKSLWRRLRKAGVRTIGDLPIQLNKSIESWAYGEGRETATNDQGQVNE